MLKIKELKFKNGIDYILEDETELYLIDWNGEKYTNGYKNHKDTDISYRPFF